MTCTAHFVSFVLVFLLIVRHMRLFQFILLFRGPHFVVQITLDRRAGNLHNQPLRKEKSDCCLND